jgi:hypothetical protein
MSSGLCDCSKLATDTPPVVRLDRGTKYGEPGDNLVSGEETLVDWLFNAPSVRRFFRCLGEVFRLKLSLLKLFARTASSLVSIPLTLSALIVPAMVSVSSSVPPAADLLNEGPSGW